MVVITKQLRRVVLPVSTSFHDARVLLDKISLLGLHAAEACMDVRRPLASADCGREETEIEAGGDSEKQA